MKFFFLLLSTTLLCPIALADNYRSQFHSLDKGLKGESHLVKFEDGRVAFIESGEKVMIEQLEKNIKRGDWLSVTTDEENTLQSFFLTTAPNLPGRTTDTFLPDKKIHFHDPTIVSSSMASSMFQKMRKDYSSKGQCFNRAHVWVYEEYKRSKTELNKVFLFFTSSYIRAYRFKWWFHVSPMVHVGGSGTSSWRILDRRYGKTPLSTKTWTNIFIRSKRDCKITHSYSEFINNQRDQHCYLYPTNVYYVVPSDLELLESENITRSTFDPIELEHAYWDGFNRNVTIN